MYEEYNDADYPRLAKVLYIYYQAKPEKIVFVSDEIVKGAELIQKSNDYSKAMYDMKKLAKTYRAKWEWRCRLKNAAQEKYRFVGNYKNGKIFVCNSQEHIDVMLDGYVAWVQDMRENHPDEWFKIRSDASKKARKLHGDPLRNWWIFLNEDRHVRDFYFKWRNTKSAVTRKTRHYEKTRFWHRPDTQEEKRFKVSETPPEGWVLGRSDTFKQNYIRARTGLSVNQKSKEQKRIAKEKAEFEKLKKLKEQRELVDKMTRMFGNGIMENVDEIVETIRGG